MHASNEIMCVGWA